jgi:hypothetical protein
MTKALTQSWTRAVEIKGLSDLAVMAWQAQRFTGLRSSVRLAPDFLYQGNTKKGSPDAIKKYHHRIIKIAVE